MLSFLCRHKNRKFVSGQRVYFTKDSYTQRCIECQGNISHSPETLEELLKEVKECGQEIIDGAIV